MPPHTLLPISPSHSPSFPKSYLPPFVDAPSIEAHVLSALPFYLLLLLFHFLCFLALSRAPLPPRGLRLSPSSPGLGVLALVSVVSPASLVAPSASALHARSLLQLLAWYEVGLSSTALASV